MSLFQLPFLSPSSPSISPNSTLLRFTHLLIILFETVHFGFDLFYSPQIHHTLLLVRFLFTLASLFFSSTIRKPTEATKSKFLVQYSTVSLLKILALFLEFYSAIELCSPETLYLSSKDVISHVLLEGTWKLFLWDQISPKQFLKSHHLLLTIYLFCLGICYQQPFLFTLRVVSQAVAMPHFFGKPGQIQRINHGKNPNLQEEINHIQEGLVLEKVLNCLQEGLVVIDSKSQIKFFNKTLQDILKLHDNFGFQDLNQNIFNLKFSNLLGASEGDNSPGDLYPINLDSTSPSAEKFHNVHNLQDLVNIYMKTEFSVENSTTVFTAKRRDQQALELQFHYISGLNEEKFLLGLIKDSTIFEQKTLLLEKEKLHYRDNLVASFSHELKTPLNSTLGFLEQAMESSMIPNEVKQRLIKPALNSGKLLFLLVSDILDYSLILSNQIQLKIKPRNPRDTVNHCLELVRLKATQKGLKIALDIEQEEDIPEIINTDHKRFAQVLINLLNNSIQYTFKGSITVLVSQSLENNLLISVRDTGIGMNKTTQQRVTNSLVQNELEGGNNGESMGIGLGLFISNKLAKLLNPESQKGLGFISEKEIGSTFYFEIKDHQLGRKKLYRDFEDLSPKRIISGFELEPKASLNIKIRQYSTRRIKNTFHEYSKGEIMTRPKVLIVDDEIFNITILENICKNCGVSTEKALNGQEALEKLSIEKYSLIFMDINMPVLDGYQATRKIGEMIKKGDMEDVAVIGVTAYVGWNKIEEGYKSGMTEILSKPVSKEVIKNILRKYKLV